MCHFISGIIDKKVPIKELNSVAKQFGLAFNICNNKHITDQIDKNLNYIIKSSGNCDCGTDFGSANIEKDIEIKRSEKKDLEKFRKKGWSETKIKRWLAEKDKSIKKVERTNDLYKKDEHAELDTWISFIKIVLEKLDSDYFGMMLHWYTGGIDTEKFKIKQKSRIRLTNLDKEILLEANEDTLYLIDNK